MAIISISLNEKLLQGLDKIQDQMGYSGRSEVIRAGIRILVDENKNKQNLKGTLHSILVVVNTKQGEDEVNKIKHDFEDIITTQLHSNFKDGKCLELFILEGSAEKTKELVNKFETNKKIEHVKLIIA